MRTSDVFLYQCIEYVVYSAEASLHTLDLLPAYFSSGSGPRLISNPGTALGRYPSRARSPDKWQRVQLVM